MENIKEKNKFVYLPFDSWKKQEIFFSPKTQKWIKAAGGLKLANRLHLVPSLSMNGAILLLPQYTLMTCTVTLFVSCIFKYIHIHISSLSLSASLLCVYRTKQTHKQTRARTHACTHTKLCLLI